MDNDNTSGMGDRAVVPPGVDRWNWGAFLLNWIWGIGNNTFIALLMFVPFVNVVMLFVLGAKGSTWAWRNKHWDSVEAFRAAQRRWAVWGVAVWALLPMLFIGLYLSITGVMRSSVAYATAASALQASPQVEQLIGHPIRTERPNGSIRISGPDGEAHLQFAAKGPRGTGMVYVDETRKLGQWRIDAAVFEDAATHKRVEFTPARQ